MKKIAFYLVLQFTTLMGYSQILIDNGPIITTNKIGIRPNYAIQGNKWDHRILTYWYGNGTNDITGNDERQGIRTAFNLWQNQVDIRFIEVCDSINADIIIRWGSDDHGDGFPFDGQGGILAHGFSLLLMGFMLAIYILMMTKIGH